MLQLWLPEWILPALWLCWRIFVFTLSHGSFRQEYQEVIGIPHRGQGNPRTIWCLCLLLFQSLAVLVARLIPSWRWTHARCQMQTEFASSRRSLWSNSSSDTSSSLFSLSVFLEIKHKLRATVSAHAYKHMRKVYQSINAARMLVDAHDVSHLGTCKAKRFPCVTWMIQYTLRILAKLSRPHHRHHHHQSGHTMIDSHRLPTQVLIRSEPVPIPKANLGADLL